MSLRTLFIGALTALPAISAETIHSVLIFTRHGDRTAKYYKDYQMTNLGATQVYSSGQFYREQYIEDGAAHQILGIAPDDLSPSQLWASAPDQSVLYQTATNFFQGLYPPLGELNKTLAPEVLANGTSVETPLNGYQFILIHGEDATDPDTIWIKGDDSCPAYTNAYNSYRQSREYNTTLSASADFYAKFQPLLAPIMGAENVSYAQAYDVFDLLNVASIHNASVAPKINSDDLSQLRYYANEWEWNHNFNASLPNRSIGGMTLAGGILRQLKSVVDGKAKSKFNLMAGSYDTFLSFFGLTNLTAASLDFQGLPNYAASMVFELYTNDTTKTFPSKPAEDLQVRFLFRNGTADSNKLNAYPLFGGSDPSISYSKFLDELSGRAIVSVDEWCTTCQSSEGFCRANASQGGSSDTSGPGSHASSTTPRLSNAAAGGIGAAVTLAVITMLGALAWVIMRKRSRSTASMREQTASSEKRAPLGKTASGSETESV